MSGFTEEWLAQRNRDVLGIGVTLVPQLVTELQQDLRPEWMIEAECTKLLEEDGWRSLRTDPVSDRSKGKGFGELGMADHLYIRYRPIPFDPASDRPLWSGPAAVMWIEFKSASGKPKKHQLEWHAKERARGALTLIAGVDFPASVQGFTDWYCTSGLRRVTPIGEKA